MENLRALLSRIDGKGYKAYKTLQGTYRFPDYELHIDHVQGDPYAAPSRISVRIPMSVAAIPAGLRSDDTRRLAVADYLARALRKAIDRFVRGGRGTGRSGEVAIAAGGQEILIRNAVLVTDDAVEVRLTIGLPAAGRRVRADDARAMLFDELPEVITAGTRYRALPQHEVQSHIETLEDQRSLRRQLRGQGLVAFVTDGATLPRRSGIDERPLEAGVVPMHAPESLAVWLELPHAGTVRGLGIPEGVTLIVGGGYHGKSTLLHALERGVYDHIPGDGREHVAADASAVKIRAEDGRAVTSVDLRPFIANLPLDKDTADFSTGNASGSTSQAANIIEALECGTRLLLIDEDTSATNFMIRDARMQALVAPDKEPITPFLHRARELYETHGVSTILVIGGSGDYFDVADTVIMMDNYRPVDVTGRARELAGEVAAHRAAAAGFTPHCDRRVGGAGLDASRGPRPVRIDARGRDHLVYGTYEIDLSAVEQCVHVDQARTIGLLIHYMSRHYADARDIITGLQAVFADVERLGPDILSPWKVGNLALPRLHETAAAINRMRGVDIVRR